MTTTQNTNMMVMDISREFDIPFKQVLSDLDKLRGLLEGSDNDLLDELVYYYKTKMYGFD